MTNPTTAQIRRRWLLGVLNVIAFVIAIGIMFQDQKKHAASAAKAKSKATQVQSSTISNEADATQPLAQAPLESQIEAQPPKAPVVVATDPEPLNITAVNDADKFGVTALMRAAAAGRTREVDDLLAAGAAPDLRDANGRSALTYAIAAGRGGHASTVQRLLRAGSTVEQSEWIAAVTKREAPALKALLRSGEKFSPLTPQGKEIVKRAQMNGGPRIEPTLLAHEYIGPQLRQVRKSQQQEREAGIAKFAKAIFPHLSVFLLALGLVPVLVTFLVYKTFPPYQRRATISIALSVAATYLLLLPVQMQQVLTHFKFWGAPIDGILLLSGGAVIIPAIVLASMVAAAFKTIFAAQKNDDVMPHRWLATGLLLAVFATLATHHLNRTDLLNRAYFVITGLPIVPSTTEEQVEVEMPKPPSKRWFWQAEDELGWFDYVALEHIEPVRAALAQGADPDVRDSLQQTALHHAAGSTNVELTEMLLAHGADPNAIDTNVNLPLCRAMSLAYESYTNDNIHKVAGMLIAHGAKIRHPDCAPVHRAERTASIRWLLQLGADLEGRMPLKPHSSSTFGPVTPLWRAAHEGKLTQLKNLLALGAAVNAQDTNSGFTPLHAALASIQFKRRPHPDKVAIVELLVAQGANLDAVAKDGTTLGSLDRHKLLDNLVALNGT